MIFRPGAPSKLTLEQEDFIWEATDPQITLTVDSDIVILEARCWNLTTTSKEDMENSILDNLEAEVKKEKKQAKKVKAIHPDYDSCGCGDSIEHAEALKKQTKKANKIKTRKDRFPKDGGKPIKASVPGYAKIPWTQATLTLIAQSPDGQLHYAKTLDEKKQFAWSNFKWILVCWPGKLSQDIFLIDDITEFRKSLGFKKKSEAVVTDEYGDEWLFEQLFAPKTGKPSVVPKSYINPLDYRYEGRF